MKQVTYEIKDPNGMHARPAGALATLAKGFTADIQVEANGRKADAKRLLALMSLGATQGTRLAFSVSGQDEEAAVDALNTFFEAQTSGEDGQA